jgi:hypothetical protein
MARDFKKSEALPCSSAHTRLTVTSSNVIVRQYKVVVLIAEPFNLENLLFYSLVRNYHLALSPSMN